ncbi:N-formyl-4-amino-5-aminomethyl-2-methylpyrimidine deformylase [subsurface metagenome]
MINKAFEHINKNETRFIKELQDFLRFPSISSQIRHKNDIVRCATWLKHHLEHIGLQAQLIKTNRHPIVWARSKSHSSKRVIIYGHYDVQPEDPIDHWRTNPFDPIIDEGFIYARGATDDKGQLFAHIKGVESLMKTNKQLPCEVIFLIEGEEESGGTGLSEYIKKNKTNLATDAIVVSDTAMFDENTPAITYGLRGLVAMEVTVRTADRELHSGIFGGVIANSVNVLSHIISKCTGTDGEIQIPGFYDGIRSLQNWEKDNIKRLGFDDDKLKSETGSKQIYGEPGFSTLEKIWARPTFEVNGIAGGYTNKGIKTIIPSSATAKISMRLVPDQDPYEAANLLTQHVNSICPDFASVEIQGPFSVTKPVLFDVDNPEIKVAWQALKHGFGAEPEYIRCGSSIPVVNTFWEELGKPVVLMGFGLDSDGAHSPNERFKIANFINGAKTCAYFLVNV